MRASPLMLCLLLSFTALHAWALDGDADPAFGTDGQVVIVRPQKTPGNATKPTGDLAVLADGRFIWAAPLDDGSVWVGRAWRNGAADATFGSDGTGRITLPACGQNRDVRLIGDGGSGAFVWSSRCLRHVLGDGTTKPDFGQGPMPPDAFFPADLAQDSAGRFVLAGREGQQGKVYRFDGAGTADPTFGTAGSVVVSLPVSNWSEVKALAVRSDGRILIGGSRGSTHGSNLVIAQLLQDGSPDPGWNDDGVVDMEPPPEFNGMIANALALDGDGSLVISGMGNNSSDSCCILITRLDTDGEIMPQFGLRLFQLSGQPRIYPFFEQRDALVLLPNHRIIVGALSFPFVAPFRHRTRFTLIRTFSDGRLDTGFGQNGWNSYTIADPLSAGQFGDYQQMHAIGHDDADGSMLILGRTFFEDNSTGDDYVSIVRARFDLIFDGTFE